VITLSIGAESLRLEIAKRRASLDGSDALANVLELVVTLETPDGVHRVETTISVPALRHFALALIRKARAQVPSARLVSHDARVTLGFEDGRMWVPDVLLRLFDSALGDWVHWTPVPNAKAIRTFERELVLALRDFPTELPPAPPLPQHPPVSEAGPSVTAWLAERTCTGSEEDIPLGFEAYCLLLHPLGWHVAEFDSGPDDATLRVARGPRAWASTAARWFASMPMVLDGRFYWKQMADRLGVPYDAELPRRLYQARLDGVVTPAIPGGAEGYVEAGQMATLVAHLKPYTGQQPCYFFYSLLFLFEDMDFSKGKCWTGPLDAVFGFYDRTEVRGFNPSVFWPTDRSWLVWSGYDDETSVVGGPRALIDALLSEPSLECVSLDEATILSWYPSHDQALEPG
jgi:hypothetical protein